MIRKLTLGKIWNIASLYNVSQCAMATHDDRAAKEIEDTARQYGTVRFKRIYLHKHKQFRGVKNRTEQHRLEICGNKLS